MPGEVLVVGTTAVLGAPLVVVIGRYYSGDDAYYETTLLGIVDGVLKDLYPRHWVTSYLDILCVGSTGQGRGVFGLTYDWDLDAESHVDLHHYRLTTYRWTGRSFVPLPERRTRGVFHRWRPALVEVGLKCEAPYGGLTGFEWPDP